MNKTSTTQARRWLAGAALLLAAGLCHAQYAWIDEKGVRQFSDRPPPPSTPLKNILRQPGGVPEATDAQATPAAAVADDGTKSKPAPSLADRNLDYAKRQRAAAEREKKDADEAAHKADMKENCDAAQANKAQLESGVRISTTDKSGERGYISDAERAQRLQKANRILSECH